MLEDRLHVDKSQTQAATSLVLSFHAGISMLTSPWIGYLADKAPNRKMSLIASLVAEMMGTIVIMISPSVPVLLIGRGIQAIGGNAAWIVGLSTLTETVGQDDTGKTLGAISSIYTSGLLFGSMASGVLLPLVGYWMTWCTALAMLAIDLMMRFVMIENKQGLPPKGDASLDVEAMETSDVTEASEQTPLLPDGPPGNRIEPTSATPPQEPRPEAVSSPDNFYLFIFTSSRALTAIACHSTMSIVLLSLDTTLPLHAYRTFGWGTAQVSLMFLFLQLPSLLLSTLMGMIKDRSGTRLPTGVGLLGMGLFLWLLGAAAEDGLRLLSGKSKSQIITMMSLVGIGTARTLVSGSGILEMTNVVKDAQTKNPHRFGPSGRLSSAYSITNFFWNTGMLVGPVLSGGLARAVGYFYMNVVIESDLDQYFIIRASELT
ncbi:hypothetical protein E4U42_003630 [Claviceps africana]|uniref:Major facilitator superfamily (MFS) profile domain-containing protein n=1 Tax=Claviceps africana TaxID=83212 RepID=A0A8K0JCQ0_9HYPO|nr:hypothetical protein E4U42_003630 [Claviceps africana]